MRLIGGPSRSRRAISLALVLVFALALLVPVAAYATTYAITIRTSASSRILSQAVGVWGKVTPRAAGKPIYLEVRKYPYPTWKRVATKTINSTSGYYFKYAATSTGTYYVRTRLANGNKSLAVKLVVKPKIPIILASTTSTQDSGLFDVLIPAFERAKGIYQVKVIAVGSGEAMALGQRKDADVLLVHSPAAEKAFIAQGYGKNRKDVMYNQFLLVGPASDPGNVKAESGIVNSFKKIYTTKSTFISRGDNSGTHTKEKAIWALAGYPYATVSTQPWYVSAGLGMGETLKMAGEKNGYTLVDSATWITNKPPYLVSIQEGDAVLYNQYGVIEVVGAKQPAGAAAFSNWITSSAGQSTIYNFGRAKYGKSLFIPNFN
jgi:tungstate transport system substrate-binding protein